jgi:hypothetical protein
MVLRATTRVDPEPDWAWLLPHGQVGSGGSGGREDGAFYRRGAALYKITPSGVDTSTVLARHFKSHGSLGDDVDLRDLAITILDAVCQVLAGKRKAKSLAKDLPVELADRFAKSLNVIPIGGLVFSGTDSSLQIGDRLRLGTLSWGTVDQISEMSIDHIGIGYSPDIGCWWAEDLLGFKADPDAYENIAPDTGVSVAAVVVSAVGTVAAVRAREQVEALLGALWLVDHGRREWQRLPPWIVGLPTTVEFPREPGYDEDSSLPLVIGQVSTRDHRTDDYINFGGPQGFIDVGTTIAAQPKLFDLIAGADTPGSEQLLARRVAAACRLALSAAQDTASDLQLLHLVVGMEALVSQHEEGAGVTDRFVRRILALLPRQLRDVRKVHGLYNLRSEVGHQGFAVTPRYDVARACGVAREMLIASVLAMSELAVRHGFRTDVELIAWLDASAPEPDNPFAAE